MVQRWRLDGRRALVTGGTKGIGEAIAAELLALGAGVAIVARNADEVAAKVAEWTGRGYTAFGAAADMTTPEGRAEAVAFAVSALGGLDILINNVGTNIRKPTTDYTPDEYAKVMETNVTSVFEMCRLAYPHLREAASGGGDAAIITVGSVAGSVYVGSGSVYGVTKAATDQLTRYLAVEWAVDGVRVNAVNPWYTDTPLARPVVSDPERAGRIIARTPNGRIADPTDISGLAAFLCLPAARHVTGQCVAVDGGFLANGGF
jgi:tropinone reductase I